MIMINSAPFLFYASAITLFLYRPGHIIYILALTAPFYDSTFSRLFFRTELPGVAFTLKPYLLFALILALMVAGRAFSRKGVKDRFVVKERFVFTPEHKAAVFGFAGFCLLSFAFSLREASSYMTELNVLLNASLIFLLPYFYRTGYIELRKLLIYISLAALCISSYILLQSAFSGIHHFWLARFQGHSTFLLMTFPLLFLGFLCYRQRRPSLFFGVTAVMAFCAIILTLSKSAWVGLAATFPPFLMAFLLSSRKDGRACARAAVLVTALVICAALLHGSLLHVRGEVNAFKTLADWRRAGPILDPHGERAESEAVKNVYKFLTYIRTTLWRRAIELSLSAPLKGYGLNYVIVEGMQGVNNTFLRVLVASGLAGFVLFIGAAASIFRRLAKCVRGAVCLEHRLFYIAIAASLGSWLIQGMAQTVINEYIIWFVAALAFLEAERITV